jgi:ABC-2 type transport system permease protein
MSAFFTLWRRELAAYFLSPIAYVFMIFFLLLMGINFVIVVNALANGGGSIQVMQAFFTWLFIWFPMIVVGPLLTMRLFAEEKRSGTIEMLMTAPVSDTAVVLAKYFGALVFYVITWLPTLAYVAILKACGAADIAMDISSILTGYLCTLLIGAFYLAIGLFCSAMTKNQIMAFIMAFAVICGLFFGGIMLFFMSREESIRDVALLFCSVQHMLDFARGSVDTRPVVFYLSGAALMLFATVKLVEARKWK